MPQNNQDLTELPHYQQNLCALMRRFTTHLESPDEKDDDALIKPAPTLGVEVEHFLIFEDGSPVPFTSDDPARPGVHDILLALRPHFPEVELEEEGVIMGLGGPTGSLSLEPAAQLEFSMRPYTRVAEVQAAYQDFYKSLQEVCAPHHIKIVTQGYHPTTKALDMPLIPKDRYHIMDSYFRHHIHSHGERMMRATTSTQVSVDLETSELGVRKLQLASALAPLLAVIADNTLTFEGQPNHLPIRHFAVWRNVDPVRCAHLPHIFDDDYSLRSYGDWMLSRSPIFSGKPGHPQHFDEPAAQVYEQDVLDKAEANHLISMVWPDVRLKTVVEIRPADSLEMPQMLGYVALIKALMYGEGMRQAEALFGTTLTAEGRAHWTLSEDALEEAGLEIQEKGWEATPYGKPLKQWIDELFDIARANLDADEVGYLEQLYTFACTKSWWEPGHAGC